MNEHETDVSVTTLMAARIASDVLAILDKASPWFWELCEEESARLQNALENAIHESVKKFRFPDR